MDLNKELSSESMSLGRWAIWCATGTVGLFFLLVASCTMHSNSIEPETIAAMAKLEEARSLVVKERISAIERLVDKGVHPVLARCSLTTSFKSDKCASIVPKLTEMVRTRTNNNESK